MAAGDHLKVFRLGYWHHGIDVGNGMVVHFNGEPFKEGSFEISKCTIEEFLNGGNLEVVQYKRCDTPRNVVQRALLRVGRGQGEYHLVFNNCEHFATFCKTGESESIQIKKAAVAVAATTAPFALKGIKIIVESLLKKFLKG